MSNNQKFLFYTSDQVPVSKWMIVNDGVMGGKSSSRLDYQADGSAVFSGEVSLENNGGFASCRMSLLTEIPPSCSTIGLRVMGDGKKYKFRIRADRHGEDIVYSADFITEKDTWTEIELPIAGFLATYRGHILHQAAALDVTEIDHIGFLIADQQSGPFSLIIDWIKIYCRYN